MTPVFAMIHPLLCISRSIPCPRPTIIGRVVVFALFRAIFDYINSFLTAIPLVVTVLLWIS